MNDSLNPPENDENNIPNNVILSPLRSGPYQLSQQKSALNLNTEKPEKKDKKDEETRKTKTEKPQEKERLEDQMNYEHLMTLEKIFQDANDNSDDAALEGGLDMAQFRVALKKTMGGPIDDRELDKIFMKVDTNCDGTVDWDEYLSYA